MTIQDYLDRAMACLSDVRMPEPDLLPLSTMVIDLSRSVEDLDGQLTAWVDAMEHCTHATKARLTAAQWRCLSCGVVG